MGTPDSVAGQGLFSTQQNLTGFRGGINSRVLRFYSLCRRWFGMVSIPYRKIRFASERERKQRLPAFDLRMGRRRTSGNERSLPYCSERWIGCRFEVHRYNFVETSRKGPVVVG